ncbi:cyclopropane fatty acyl phospholipid synthase [Luteimonas aquatica]|uniref:cyclopropane fatty acyl phospholipid synthase n=1 Tax=Luteimonas aquatica TaxID=450364 RepID=UPI001F562B91|nr:cyclopropane fatty acyl phospholipid synthase [Luteimonas aquatica]
MSATHPFQDRIQSLLAQADIQVDGDRPWDMRMHDPHLPARLMAGGSLALGESFMDGAWDADSLDEFLFRLLQAHVDERVHGIGDILLALRARLLNMQSGHRAFDVGERHYDLGNDLYAAMLGKRLVYSCGYWHRADGGMAASLDEAQEAKLDLICRKLGLRPGMRVLDIGCGWGEALKFAAERYGVSGVGVTVSREQAEFAQALCAGLPDDRRVEIRVQDYRALTGAAPDERFDRILSVGMFEHVGVRNYRAYFEVALRCLAEDGLFLLHSIGGNKSVTHSDPWITKYIFANSMLPSARQIAEAAEGLFVIEDWHNFGADYDLTLQAWRRNIEAAWERLPPRYDERFRRMWRFYLAASMASFRARRIQLWQLVLSPGGVPGGYVAPR